MVTIVELAEAARAADGTLLRITIERRSPTKPDRYVVRNLAGEGRVIKRFRAHETALHVYRWIDGRFPDGVFMSAPAVPNKPMLRYRHSVWTKESWERALRMTEAAEVLP